MKITDIIKSEKPTLSFEVFPPKTSDNFESVKNATEQIAQLSPSYMSVTYGAGGSTSYFTAEIAEDILKMGITPLAHMTCVVSQKEKIHSVLSDLKSKKIENILALRGDIPNGMTAKSLDYKYASDLTKDIKNHGDFCVGGACYPEVHPESSGIKEDIEHLKIKVESGCEFLTTQMFFDNNIFYNFMYRLLRAGINVPVVPGIMPVTNASQLNRICSLSGSVLPLKFKKIVERFGEDSNAMKEAGIAYATEQIIDLYANGINAVHIYSMNKPDVAKSISNNLRYILK